MIGSDNQRDERGKPEKPDNQGRSAPRPAEGPDDTPPPTRDSPQG